MARQPHIQLPGLIHTPECYEHPKIRRLTYSAICRCGKVLYGSTRKVLSANQKRHYTICTQRHIKFNTETWEVEYDSRNEL